MTKTLRDAGRFPGEIGKMLVPEIFTFLNCKSRIFSVLSRIDGRISSEAESVDSFRPLFFGKDHFPVVALFHFCSAIVVLHFELFLVAIDVLFGV